MSTLIIVTGESPWPPTHGGKVRTAGLIEALSDQVPVRVIILRGPAGSVPQGISTTVINPDPSDSKLRSLLAFAAPEPRLGRWYLPRKMRARLAALIDEGEGVVMYVHSYLAAVGPQTRHPIVCDFPNLEAERLASFTSSGGLHNRLSARVEAIKARRWEPRVARNCEVAVALDASDAGKLRSSGGSVVTVPNGISYSGPSRPSPPEGPATFFSSADYGPNRNAGRWLMDHVWPLVVNQLPEAELVVAGRATREVFETDLDRPGIRILGQVPDVEAVLDAAGVVLCPVTTGAGLQLKVLQAAASGRCMVLSPYSARSLPAAAQHLGVVADTPEAYADAVVRLLADVPARHEREERARAEHGQLATWSDCVAPLVAALERIL